MATRPTAVCGGLAGAPDCPLRLAAAVALAAVAAGCGGGGPSVPDRLADGAVTARPPVALEGIDGRAVLTRLRAVPADRAGPRLASCLHALDGARRAVGVVVERTGVNGVSVTFRERGEHRLLGCDGSPGSRGETRPWCGLADGRLIAGHLSDPRLGIGCRARHGRPVGFAWVEPGRKTRYVAVEQRGYAEVYETAGGLPVRVTTSEVRVEEARALFRLSEHDAQGRLLRRQTLEAVVAG